MSRKRTYDTISNSQRALVLAALTPEAEGGSGLTQRQAAELFGIAKSTVADIASAWRKEGRVAKKPKGGATVAPHTSAAQESLICEAQREHNEWTLEQLREYVEDNTPLSAQRRAARQANRPSGMCCSDAASLPNS